MASVEQGKEALISGIQADVHEQEGQIIQEAERQAEEKRKNADQKVASILDDARQKAGQQAETIGRKAVSAVELEIKQQTLRLRAELVQGIMARVEDRLSCLVDHPEYRDVLIDWMTEAAVGLDVRSATVNASEKERALIDDECLGKVMERVGKQTGKTVALTVSDADPLGIQGVVLTDSDGRMAYNNQVRTRMQRFQRRILTLIYDALFSDKKE